MPNYQDPGIQTSASQGESILAANKATEGRGLAKYLAQFGVQAPEFQAQAGAQRDVAERNAKQAMHAQLAELAMRTQLHQQYMDQLWENYRAQQSGQKRDMWSTLLSSAGQIGGGILGGLRQPGRGQINTAGAGDPFMGMGLPYWRT